MRHTFLRRPVVRLVARALIVSLALGSLPAEAAAAMPRPAAATVAPGSPVGPSPAVAPPPPVQVNRVVPAVEPVPLFPEFSAAPSATEITQARVFGEPLLPAGADPSLEENQALASAITAYLHGGNPEAVGTLLAFGKQYPQSAWWPSVLTGIGATHRRTGYFTRAAAELKEAWRLSKDGSEEGARATADSALSNLLEIQMQFGQVDALEEILKEIEGREVRGGAAERVREAKTTAWGLRNDHGTAIPSGPIAIGQILKNQRPETTRLHPKLRAFHATPDGASLADMMRLAREVGLHWQMARRERGASVAVPSVIHLRSGHFAALVRQEGDRFMLDDPLLGGEVWLSTAALEDEASGYFLVPDNTLGAGWKSAGLEQAEQVRGKCIYPSPDRGATGEENEFVGCPDPEEPCDDEEEPDESSGPNGAAVYRIHALLASVNIRDTPIHYRPARGPAVAFRAVYNHREANQPQTFHYSNLGSRWTFNWLSYIEDNPANGSEPVNVYLRGGGTEIASGFSGGAYAPTERRRAIVVRTSSSPIRYERRKANGWVEVFEQPDSAAALPRRVFMTEVRDPQGNALHMTYDSQLRLVAVSDSLNQVTTLSYDSGADPLKLTKVTDPFGRLATLGYDPSGQLVHIKDVVGLSSRMTYGATGFVARLATPHGATSFSAGPGVNSHTDFWVQATDPFGGKQRAEFVYTTSAIPATAPPGSVPLGFGEYNQNINQFNGFFFSKGTLAQHGHDYTKAAHTRWMRSAAMKVTDRRQSIFRPSLGNMRVWYGYSGGSFVDQVGPAGRPSVVARVLDDGTSKILRSEFNVLGKRTRRTDALGRVALFGFAPNGIDQLFGRVKNGMQDETLWSATYNTIHRPLTVTDASGQTVTLTWNTYGQIETIVTPPRDGLTEAQRTTTLVYNAFGQLESLSSGLPGNTFGFTYDGYGRVRTVTDPDKYTLIVDYDALNRPIRLTYPDASYEELVWDGLNPGSVRDRLGRWSYLYFDSLRRLTSMRDTSGATVSMQWCPCGGLDKLIDAKGNVTRWERDDSGRVVKEFRADNSFTEYSYEGTTNRVKEVKDPKGQITRFEYFPDDQLKRVSYPNVPTLSEVNFTYEVSQGRVSTMTDGTGTTTYSYYPLVPPVLGSGQLQSVDGPLSNDTITFTYDELGRPRSRSVNGVNEAVGYDALGRLTSVTNALGAFGYNYEGVSDRSINVTYPNGQQTDLSYFDASEHWRLQQILHKKPGGALLSRHAYTYSGTGSIKTWQQETDTGGTKEYEFRYDGAERLTSATLRSAAPPTVLKRYVYSYDAAGNRTSEQIDSAVTQSSHNNMNQATQIAPGGTMRFAGATDEAAQVTVAGQPATVAEIAFERNVQVGSGPTQLQVKATDGSGNLRTNTYQVSVSGSTRTLIYDVNGNLLSDGVRTYEWDGLDQLTAVNQGTHRSEFSYDGVGRRIRIVEKENGTSVEDRRFLWDDLEIAEEQNQAGTTLKRHLAGGVQQGGTGYFMLSDHLDSVREMTDASGTARARYEFDPYGRRTKTAGDLEADHGFAAMLTHGPTNLGLAVFRGYEPSTARWLNQDPIGLSGGMNLYGYVEGNPITRIDSLGLAWWDNGNDFLNSQGILWLANPWSANVSAGAGQVLSFHLTTVINNASGASSVINPCDQAFAAGQKIGTVLTTAIGLATGMRQSLPANSPVWKNWSHWIPARWSGPRGMPRLGGLRLPTWITGASWNGKFVTVTNHALNDPVRFGFMTRAWRAMNPINPAWLRQLNRLPPIPGALFGLTWGAGMQSLCP